MTLQYRCDINNIQHSNPTIQQHAVSITIDPFRPARVDLFYLEDYRVMSTPGVVVWLVPITPRDDAKA